MSIIIKYPNQKSSRANENLVLFSDDKFSLGKLKNYLSTSEYLYIQDLLKTSDFKKNLFVYELNSKKKIILISIKKKLKTFDIENLGAEFYVRVNNGKNCNILF